MIKFTVYDQPVRHMEGVGKTSGKPYAMDIQTVYAHVVDEKGMALPVPEKFECVLDKGQAAYAPGEYTLSPGSIYVDRQGRLALSPKLVPFKPRG